MRRFPALPSKAQLGRWCACALLLLLPGSFLALPVVWLVRRRRLAAGG